MGSTRGEQAAADDERLNEFQQRHLLVSCQYIDKLLGEIQQTALASSSRALFPRHVATLTAVQKQVLGDYVARIRTRLLAVLDSQGLHPRRPDGNDVFAIRTTLTFVEVAIEELKPKYMRGYGAIPDAIVPQIDGIVDELGTIVRKLSEYLAEDPARDVQARLARLEQGRDDVQSLALLDRVITAHGLVEYRPRLAMLVERASSRSFEIAVFGRVSSGKSSLLNHILEAPVLPVGITPVTAVPTRIAHGREPRLLVSCADRPDAVLPLDRLPEFVTEQQNPSNARHVIRLLIELPLGRLRDGVVFVDTPGLGSLARGGAEQTMAYLPRCDLGAVLVDAGSTLTPDDLLTIQALRDAAIPVTVLLSKADLISEVDRDRAIAYIRDQLRTELSVGAAVHPVSVVPGHSALLDRWFATEIEPLYERHREAARASIARKIEALREAVQATLRARLERYARGARLDPAALQDAERALREAGGLFEPALQRCEQVADGIAVLGGEVLHQTAARLCREGPGGGEDEPAIVREIGASLREVVGDRVERVRLEVAGLESAGTQSIDRAARLLVLGTDPSRPGIDALPQFAFPLDGFTIRHASLLAFSRPLQIRYIEGRLRRRLGQRLDETLAVHARLVGAWARRAIDATRAAFEQQAEPVRTAFERLRQSPADPAPGADSAGVARDLEALDQMGVSPAPAARGAAPGSTGATP